jgi:hypothetical protein
MIGQCDSRTLCLDQLTGPIPPGFIALISVGVAIVVAVSAIGGYVGWKIFHAGKLSHGHHGGAAHEFATE